MQKNHIIGILCAWIIILSGCTPTLPCDPCAELDALSTRVAILEGVSLTLTPSPSAFPSSTPSRTATREPTETPTFTATRTETATLVPPTRTSTKSGTPTPEPLVTMTPTATHGAYVLELSAQSLQTAPGTRVSFTLAWDGPAAELSFGMPQQTCCPIPEESNWIVGGPTIKTFTVWFYSNATGAKMFQAVARIGGEIVKTDSVIVDVFTGTPTITPTPTRVGTPSASQVLQAGKWYSVNTGGAAQFVCLKVAAGEGHIVKILDVSQGQFRCIFSGTGWRCLSAWNYMLTAYYASVVWFASDAELYISDCRLCSQVQVSWGPEDCPRCEVRG